MLEGGGRGAEGGRKGGKTRWVGMEAVEILCESHPPPQMAIGMTLWIVLCV